MAITQTDANLIWDTAATRDNVFRAPSWRTNQTDIYWNFEAVFNTVYEKLYAMLTSLQEDVTVLSLDMDSIKSVILQFNADAQDEPSQVQNDIATAVWAHTPRTTTS